MKKQIFSSGFWKTGFLFFLVVAGYLVTRSFSDAEAGHMPEQPPLNNHLPERRIFTLVIGIDNYAQEKLEGCVNDAKHLTQKIKSEFDTLQIKYRADSLFLIEETKRIIHSIDTTGASSSFRMAVNSLADSIAKSHLATTNPILIGGKITEITQFCLLDEQASILRIKAAIDSIAHLARPDDIFFFYYAGRSFTDSSSSEMLDLIPDSKMPNQKKTRWGDITLSISILSEWFSLIQCDRQYFVSEAGSGSEFRNSLILNLFEKNVFIGSAKNQNRVIITTNGLGIEHRFDGYGVGGSLGFYLYNVKNLLGILNSNSPSLLEKLLLIEEFKNPSIEGRIYTRIYQEKEFIPLFAGFQNNNSRGPQKQNFPQNNSEHHSKGKNIAVIIGTNNYSDNADWRHLQNPVSDGNAIGKILNDKYGFDVRYLLNKPKDSILSVICNLKNTLDSSDNVIIFFAGHGYYDALLTQGYVVATDSKSLQTDIYSKSSYIHWSDITLMIDALPAKNIFLISDVCFGGLFDATSKQIIPHDYKNQKTDITPQEFADRKSKHISRIFLASGNTEVPDYTLKLTDHSPFAAKLIDGLSKEKGFTTPGQLFEYMSMNATEPVLKYFGRHDAAEGEFVMLEKTK